MYNRTAIAAFLAATILVSTAWAGSDDPVTFNDLILKQAVIPIPVDFVRLMM
jgi:hypothetical protein